MKNYKIFFAFIIITLMNFQCQIDSENKIEYVKIEIRSTEECNPDPCSGPLLPAAVEDIPLPDEFSSPFLDCKLTGEYWLQICNGNEIRFFDFNVYFEQSCQWLINQFESLPEDEYIEAIRKIETHAQKYARNKIMQQFAIGNPDIQIFNKITSYDAFCTKMCIVIEDWVLDKDDRGTQVESRHAGNRWKFMEVPCGDGCCITRSVYKRNATGELELFSEEISAHGDCAPITEDSPSWLRSRDCGEEGNLFGDCEAVCR